MAFQLDITTGEVTEYCDDCDNGTDQPCIECQWHYSVHGKDRFQQFVLDDKAPILRALTKGIKCTK